MSNKFKFGDKVHHKTLGEGVVIRAVSEGTCVFIVFENHMERWFDECDRHDICSNQNRMREVLDMVIDKKLKGE